jgi:glycerol-1-phosphatase
VTAVAPSTPSGDRAGRTLLGTSQPLATSYDVALLDLDGVVYIGSDPIPGAAAALAKARAAGMRVAFVTNNASRGPAAVAAHLVELGVPATADDIVTSSQAAAAVIIERCGVGATVLVTGSAALREAVEQVGLKVVASADDRPDAVVQGYSPDLGYADLAETALAVRSGAFWVATNADSTLPSRRGLLPGNGSLVAAVALATGQRPVVAGKPELPLHAEGVARTHAQNPLVVGDRLDTDIEGAFAADTDCMLVLTGVTRAADLVDAPIQHRPTFLALDLAGLLEPVPDVDWDGTVARCGGWAATDSTGPSIEIRVDGEGRAIDGLRAVLTAAWMLRRPDGSKVDASGALHQLGFA